ncbi:Adenine specific DNA methylase N-4/N-6 [Azotobacter chroococcum NCIMB 8003]|uniref:site-specific DNA-methyltransferase (adenine-specific) n=1 Tax=Azotobacter chroococcum NCIMB 8003 TaxID=1328314 RepID=A0A0C4WIJ7_9GAMM|nr:Adenine specific DNA methylase N-4/N-6 [Azotobacter chroococcum NCIMB 8003]
MSEKTKLELTWIGKDKRPRLEPRILIEDKALSYRAEASAPLQGDLLADERPPSFHDNLLIQGDNLLALKALESKYAGEVKCIFIDPPYNTGSAFTHYDDGLEHSMWLTMMRDRLEIIRTLLADEGSLWVSIDDNECHYLKILCDEVFGRANFIATVIWEKTTSARNDARFFSADHDYVIVYAKEIKKLELNRVKRTESAEAAYTNPDNDPRGPWREGDYKLLNKINPIFFAVT